MDTLVVISRSMRCSLVLTMLMLLAASPLLPTEQMGDEIPIIGRGMLSVLGQGALTETAITESIVIDGDQEYLSIASELGLEGAGTEADPILWEDLTFEIGEGISGIEFHGTKLHTVIRNCSFQRSSSVNTNIYLSGIIIEGSDSIRLISSVFTNIHYPAYLEDASNCVISKCIFDGGVNYVRILRSQLISILDNQFIYGGIRLISSGNCTISDNIISSVWKEIYLEQCDNCTLDGNVGEWSYTYNILIRYSMDITLIDNENNGLLMIVGDLEHFKTLGMIGKNTAMGKEIIFFRDTVFNESWEYPLGQMAYFVNCTNVNITQPEVTREDIGVILTVVSCINLTLYDCILGDEAYEEITIRDSEDISVKRMNLYQGFLIELDNCRNITIADSQVDGTLWITDSSNGCVKNNSVILGDIIIDDSSGIDLIDNYFCESDLTVYDECDDIEVRSNRFVQYSSLIIMERGADIDLFSNTLDRNSTISISASLAALRTYTVVNNSVGEEPFIFLIDEDHGGDTWEGAAGQFFLAGVSNLTFMDQSIASILDKMTLYECRDIIVRDTEFTGAEESTLPSSISVIRSERIEFEGNDFMQTKIEIEECKKIEIGNNVFETLYKFQEALEVDSSDHISIQENRFETGDALGIYQCTDVQIFGNEIDSETGMLIVTSRAVNIVENNITGSGWGVEILDCDGIMISGNKLDGYSMPLYIQNSRNDTIQSNRFSGWRISMDLNNWIDGTFRGNVIDSEGFQGLSVIESVGVIIDGNVIVNNNSALEVQGISLIRSNECVISACSFPENTREGIILDQCNDSVIQGNTFFRNLRGLAIFNSNNNSISENLFQWNSGTAIAIAEVFTPWGSTTSSNNTIWNNTFYQNHGSQEVYNEKHYQVIDDGSNNTWYSAEGIGNIWSDWTSPNYNGDNIVDEPYPIHGSAGSWDLYPITDVIDVRVDWMRDRDRSNLGFYFLPLLLLFMALAIYFLVNSVRPYPVPREKVKMKPEVKPAVKKVKKGK